jgi:hypothetical protein
MYIFYFIGIFILLYLWICFGFWNKQPMTHIYNIYKPGIITEIPVYNKFVDLFKISFYNVNDLTLELQNELYEYVNENQHSYHKKTHFLGYLKKGFISIYKENTCIRGCITSRHVKFTLDKEELDAYATDFIYADTPYILKCLIQTHEYRKHTEAYPTSIITSMKNIRFLVPLTSYNIQWLYTRSFIKYKLSLKTKIIKNTPQLLNDIYGCFKKNKFKCQITPTIYTLTTLIESKNISIYSIYNPFLIAILFFKNTYELEDDLSIVDWIGTIILDSSDMNLIQSSISTIIYGIQKTFKIIRIHQVSNTLSYSNYFKMTECKKYVYNYGVYTILASNCFFL